MALPPTPTGPTTFAERQLGLGTSWLLPLVDGVPPIGWDEASAYLALPIALVAVQYATSALTSPPIDPKVRRNVCPPFLRAQPDSLMSYV
jgi:YidC/Oxa1 family membrane protein insertase